MAASGIWGIGQIILHEFGVSNPEWQKRRLNDEKLVQRRFLHAVISTGIRNNNIRNDLWHRGI